MDTSRFQQLRSLIMRLAGHYTWAFVAVVVVTVVSFAFSAHYLISLESDLKDVYENDIRGGDAVQSAALALVAVDNALKNQVVFTDRKSLTLARSQVQQQLGVLKAAMVAAGPRFYTPKAKQALLQSRDNLKTFISALQETQSVLEQGRRPDSKTWNSLREASENLRRDLDLLVANRLANGSIGMGEIVSQLRWSLIFTAVLLLGTLAVRIVLYRAGHPKRRKTD